MAALVGVVGSRSLPPQFAPLVRAVASAVVQGGRAVAVGCSPGVRVPVVAAVPAARVFSVQPGSGRGGLVRRSVQFIQAVAASGPGAGLFGFAVVPCPPSVRPSASPSRCFCGGGSGTWAELALGVGLGLPVSVFWCASGPARLPSWWWPGAWAQSWSPAIPGLSVQAFSLASVQLELKIIQQPDLQPH